MFNESSVYPPALFVYQVTPTVVPHSGAAPSSTDLMFFISNTTGHDVEVEQIVFDLRYGVGDGDLTTTDLPVPRQVVGPDWGASGERGGQVRLAPRGEAAFHGLRAGESLGLAVPDVVVNDQPGVANLIVWEVSDEPRRSYVSVAKTAPGLAITTFQASPVQLDGNHPKSELRWTATGPGVKVTLSHDGITEEVEPDSHQDVAPKVTTLYTLTATAGGRAKHEQLTVYVPQVALVSFGAEPPLIAGGGSSVLSWSLTNASKAMILASGEEPDPGPVDLPYGRLTVAPKQLSTTYTLAAEGFGNSVTGVAQVDLVPTVEEFSISPSRAPRGRGLPLTLRWKVRDANAVSVTGQPSPQPPTGSAVVTPAQTTSYTLGAKRLTSSRTVRAQLAGPITSLTATGGGANTIAWGSAGADFGRLRIGAALPIPVNRDGSYPVGRGRSTLYLVSEAADWASYADIELLDSPPGTPTVTATCDYGINAEGATVRLEYSIPFGTAVTVENGPERHVWEAGQGPATFEVHPSGGGVTWRLEAPGIRIRVYPGEPWASSASNDGVGGGVGGAGSDG